MNDLARRVYNRRYYVATRERRLADARVWYATNTERVRAQVKARYAADPERIRANVNTWRAANPERVWANAKARYAADGDSIRAYALAWARANPGHRCARLANVLATLTAAEWEAILEAAGHACIYCGSHKRITQDHLTPLSRGGDHIAENVAPACLPCNSQKHTKTVEEFLAEVS